jgi:hypothetical protein
VRLGRKATGQANLIAGLPKEGSHSLASVRFHDPEFIADKGLTKERTTR